MKIGALLKNRGFSERFKATVPGTAVLDWSYLPPGAKLRSKGKHAPVLVAAGTTKFQAAGTATVKLRLTAAGTRLLRGAKRIHVTATGTFTPVGGKALQTDRYVPDHPLTGSRTSSARRATRRPAGLSGRTPEMLANVYAPRHDESSGGD